MKNKKLIKGRCKFYVACGNQATTVRYHTFLKKELKVCNHCAETNEYLVKEVPSDSDR